MQKDTDNSDTSLSLLERAKQHDPAAWGRLVQLYSPLIFYWARRAGLTEERSADIVQEVWASVTSALSRFERDHLHGTFRGWLWTIARNKVRDLLRRDSSQALAAGGTEARLLLESLPELEPVEGNDAADHTLLRRALELVEHDFEPHTWQAFWLMTVEEMPAAHVAEKLGIASNAVHQARFRVLRRLREELAGLVKL